MYRALVDYGNFELFIIDTTNSGLISINALPLTFSYENEGRIAVGSIMLRLNGVSLIPEQAMDVVQKVVASMNLVLRELVPGLTIGIEKLGMQNNPKVFEKLAFLYLAKQIQRKNALNLNARWWKNVEVPIKTAYAEEVFKKVWPKISLSKDEDSRISDCNFAFTNKEMRFVGHTREVLERVLDEAYAEAYIQISELL